MATPILRKTAPDFTFASTSAGDIYLSPSLLAVVTPDEAWLGIRELHFASIGDRGYDYVTDVGSMLPGEAQAAYSSAVAGVLGQLAAIGPRAADNLLGSLNDFVDIYGGFDGVEGISMTAALSSAQLGDPSESVQNFQWLASGLGMPPVSGGGFGTTTVFNPATNCFGLPGTAQVQQGWQQASHEAVGGFIQRMEDYAFDGLSAAGTALGLSARDAREVASGIMETASAIGIGAAAGSFAGPVGAVVGGVIGFVVGLADSIFGGHDSSQHDAAQGVAKGEHVVVHGDCPVEKNGGQQVVGKDGSTGPAPSGATGGGSPDPPPGSVIKPTPEKCPVDDDGTAPGFNIPGWGPSPMLLGAALPIGPGVDALTSTAPLASDFTGIQLAALPSLDEAGTMVSGGAALTAVASELRLLERSTKPVVIGDGDAWAGLTAQLQTARPRHGRAVPPALLVQSLRTHGFTPQDSVSSVLRTLHQRYGY